MNAFWKVSMLSHHETSLKFILFPNSNNPNLFSFNYIFSTAVNTLMKKNLKCQGGKNLFLITFTKKYEQLS